MTIADEQDENDAAKDEKSQKVVMQDGEWVWVKIDEDMLCRECGENERDISQGKDFPLCKKCAKQQYHYPVKGWVLLIAAIVLISSVLGAFMLPVSAENGKAMHAANEEYNQNKLASAGTAYAEIYGKDYSNKHVAKRLAETLYRAGNWQNIVEVIDTSFSASDLKLTPNEDLAKMRQEVAFYNNTNTELEKMYNELETSVRYEEVTKKLDAMNTSAYSQVCVEYYRYKFAVLFNRPKEEVFSIIMGAYQSYPEYGWLLLNPLASAQRQMTLYEDAIASATSVLADNAENAEAYRQLSIAYLLKEDYKSAIGFATSSYFLKKTEAAANVLLAAYIATGDEEQYNSFLAEMANNDMEPNYFIYQLGTGETTIEKAFLEGEE